MSQTAIVQRRKELDAALADAHAEVEKIQADMRALQRRCEHPNAKRTSHMGESCLHCYDCGNCP